MDNNLLEEYTVSIFRVGHEDGRRILVRNVGTHPHVYIASQPGRLQCKLKLSFNKYKENTFCVDIHREEKVCIVGVYC
jgi:hypothetical protein